MRVFNIVLCVFMWGVFAYAIWPLDLTHYLLAVFMAAFGLRVPEMIAAKLDE